MKAMKGWLLFIVLPTMTLFAVYKLMFQNGRTTVLVALTNFNNQTQHDFQQPYSEWTLIQSVIKSIPNGNLVQLKKTDFRTDKGINIPEFLRKIAGLHSRIYLTDFQFNHLLSLSQQFDTRLHWFKLTTPTNFVPIDEIFFILMSSSVTRHKAKNQLDSWLSMTRNFYFFADKNDSTLPNFITLPEIANLPNKSSAQHRQLRGIKWLRGEILAGRISEQSWFVMADDDSWINLPALQQFLFSYHHDLPVTFGFVWDLFGRTAFHSGGGAIVLSKMAFNDLSDYLYSEKFIFNGYNDITVGNACLKLNILRIHSDKFYFDPVNTVHGTLYPPMYVGKISFHHMKNPKIFLRMTCDSTKFWNFPQPKNCNTTDFYWSVRNLGGM